MRNALIDSTSGRVIAYGYCDFTPEAGQEVVTWNGLPAPVGVPIEHLIVVAEQLTEASQAQKDAADVVVTRQQDAAAIGAVSLRLVASVANLPLPPPKVGLMVAVRDNGNGSPAIAISSKTRWGLIVVNSIVGP